MDCITSLATTAGATSFPAVFFPGRVAEAARMAHELGFDGIEIGMKSPSELPAGELRSLLDTYGLELATVPTGRIFMDEKATLSDPDEGARRRVLERVKELVAYAAEFKAPVLIGLLRGERPVEGDLENTLDVFAQSMREIADYAASLGSSLLVEAINRYETQLLNTAGQTVEMVERIGRPNVKILLDVFHMNIEEVSISDAIRETGSLLGHFHIVDSNRQGPGRGHVDFDDIGQALRDIRYQGWISAEHIPVPDDWTAARRTRLFIEEL